MAAKALRLRPHARAPIGADRGGGRLHEASPLVELAWDGHRVLACAMGRRRASSRATSASGMTGFPPSCARSRSSRGGTWSRGVFLRAGSERAAVVRSPRQRLGKAQRIVLACVDLHRLDGEDLRSVPIEAPEPSARARQGRRRFRVFSKLEGPLREAPLEACGSSARAGSSCAGRPRTSRSRRQIDDPSSSTVASPRRRGDEPREAHVPARWPREARCHCILHGRRARAPANT